MFNYTLLLVERQW